VFIVETELVLCPTELELNEPTQVLAFGTITTHDEVELDEDELGRITKEEFDTEEGLVFETVELVFELEETEVNTVLEL
jgi:hypothetical protein